MWYARIAEFLQLPILQTLRWLRIVGDTMFLAGVLALVWFLLGLWTGWSYERKPAEVNDWSGTTVPSVAGD
jgi:nitric oxide reductase subunit B